MPEYVNILDYWRVIRKRKRVIILTFLLAILAALYYTINQPKIYQTTTIIKFEERRTMASLLTELVTWSTADTIMTETETVKSHKIIKETAKQLGLINEKMKQNEIDAVIVGVAGSISARQIRRTNLIEITVSSDDPNKVVKIANALTNMYIDDNLESKNKEAQNLCIFIEEQKKRYEKALEKSEEELQKFKEKAPLAKQTLLESGDVGSDPVFAKLKSKLVDLQMTFFHLKQRFTERHPRIIEIKSEIEKIKEQLLLPKSSTEFARLTRNRGLNNDLYIMFSKKLEEARIAAAEKAGDITIVKPAIRPTRPVSPNMKMNLLLGIAFGIFLGFATAFITESMDTSIGTIEDVEEYLKLPVLGIIPHIELRKANHDFWKNKEPEDKDSYELIGRLIIQHRPKSPPIEAYRSLSSNIQFSGLDKVGNSFMFTSVGAREGKTITTANCAASFAQMGKKVVLVDCDLRRPMVHKIFGIGKERGLYEAIIGSLKLDEVTKDINDILLGKVKAKVLLKTRGIENLSILTCGRLPPNPGELLNSQKITDLIEELKKKFDIVLLDTTPVLISADASVLASKVDGTILVYMVGKVARGALRRTKIQLESAKAKIIGVVLNNIKASEMYPGYPYHYYHYKYYYGEKKEKG